MAAALAALFASRSRWFDLGVFAAGLLVAGWSTYVVVRDGIDGPWPAVLCVPLIVAIARFPILLDTGDGGIEVGFESAILMFLLCTLSPHEALVIWSASVMLTHLPSDKRLLSRLFNVGVVILAGAASAAVVALVSGGRSVESPFTLLAVALAAAAFFATDFVLSAISVAIETRTSVFEHLVQRGTLLAVACLVLFDCLGYLGAVVAANTPKWTLLLLGVPLATLLIATRAATRGAENARRLEALFDAAVRAQTLSDAQQVVAALTDDARKLLRIREVELRSAPPRGNEIGARVRRGQQDAWIVVPERQRARSTAGRDQEALEALAAVASDAFGRLRLTDDMTHLAWHDTLTDLPNRGLLKDRVEHALEVSRRRGTRMALLFIDLDGFKPVNDRFGHAAGDALLVDVARRLRGAVRSSDTVARLGGDEFAVLLEDVNPLEVNRACDRILAVLSRGADVAGHHLVLSASVGVAFADASDTSESMLRNADLAMYEAKSRGKSQWVEYDSAIGRSRLQRLELAESLRASVDAGDLTLVYQPVVRTATGFIVGVEALARWQSNGVAVPPDVFIPLAEETGLVVPLGNVVLDHAARDAVAIRQAAGDDIRISVNVSAQQLREPEFVAKVERAITEIGYPALVLEITERESVENDEAFLAAMKVLSSHGVPFAIDDFGVGFSSIGYLQDMPVQMIKTDLSFAEGIDRDERSCGLLCSISMMGQALGLDVVVEGIERIGQLEHVRDHVHAPYAQGYLIDRPMPLDQLLRVIRKNRAEHRPPDLAPGRDLGPTVPNA
jgi:diguanylate cyclase (GGDEF)-like protein